MSRLAYLSGALRVSTSGVAEAGGPRSHVLGVIGAFERAGWEVERYIAGDQAWATRLAGNGREATVRDATWRAAAADAVRIGSGRVNRVAARTLGDRFDLAYERFGSFQALGRSLQRRSVPWVVETSGPFFHEAKVERATMALTRLAERHERDVYDRCDVLVCVSDSLRDWLVDHGVRGDHTHVMPNGVDVDRFDPSLVDAPVSLTDDLVVGFVGTLLAWQGLDLLLEAVARARRAGTPVRAVIVGDGPELVNLRRLAALRSIGDAVEFAGRVPAAEVPRQIARFDLGVSAHVPLLDGHMYHSPLKLYEYLAMGVPLLAASHPEAARLVAGTGTGFLFPPGDVDALAETLGIAAAQTAALRAAGPALRRYAVEHHSWDRRVADLLTELDRRGLVGARAA